MMTRAYSEKNPSALNKRRSYNLPITSSSAEQISYRKFAGVKPLGSLSTRVFETRTATGRENSAFHGSGVSQIFILIISNGEKILGNENVVV